MTVSRRWLYWLVPLVLLLTIQVVQSGACATQEPSISQRMSDELAAAGLVSVGQTVGTEAERAFFVALRNSARCWGQMTLHGAEKQDALLEYLCSDDPVSSALLLSSGATSRARAQADGCRGGALDACVALGLSFERGQHGLRLDPGRMMRLYYEACEGHYALGCVRMARHYTTDKLIPPDPQRALELFSEGCASGLLDSCTKGLLLGVESTDVDPSAVRELATRACLQEHADGCNTLGVMRYRGLGGELDPEGATRAFQEACQYGSQVGCENHEREREP